MDDRPSAAEAAVAVERGAVAPHGCQSVPSRHRRRRRCLCSTRTSTVSNAPVMTSPRSTSAGSGTTPGHHPEVATLLDHARAMSTAASTRSRRRTRKIEAPRSVERVHQLLRPMTPHPAPRADDRTLPVVRPLLDVHGGAPCRLRPPVNLAGHPALTLPVGFSSEGLPIGGQLVGPPWSECGPGAVGRAYENVTDWHLPRPDRRQSTTAPALATASDARCGR